jgi:SAM-dependent methyltransferase
MAVLDDALRSLEQNARVLDVGCFGFSLVERAQAIGRSDLLHYGVDMSEPSVQPPGFVLRCADLRSDALPFDDDLFDLVVASHILEHLPNYLECFAELVRVTKPGGILYIETPSERSLWLPGFPFQYEKFFSLSFYDDPTHCGRPFSPQGLYRLGSYYDCEDLRAGYFISWWCRLLLPFAIPIACLTRNAWLLEYVVWRAVGWSAFMLCKKPSKAQGRPRLKYDIPPTRSAHWLTTTLRVLLGKRAAKK